MFIILKEWSKYKIYGENVSQDYDALQWKLVGWKSVMIIVKWKSTYVEQLFFFISIRYELRLSKAASFDT